MVVTRDNVNIVLAQDQHHCMYYMYARIFTSKSSGEEDRTGIGILTPGLEGIGTSLVLKMKLEVRF